MTNFKESLSYDDVLLVPQYSSVRSRSDVDLSIKIKDYTFSHPIIPANMKTITGKEMALEVIKSGGLAIIHRFMSVDDQIDAYLACKEILEYSTFGKVAVSVGVKDDDKNSIPIFLSKGVSAFCIDIAHGDSVHCIEMIKFIKSFEKVGRDILVIAGNVATGNGAVRLWKAGADIVKVGVGPGSLCTTRIETGNGVPQLSAVIDVYEARDKNNLINKYFIADGGIKSAGDVVKALCYADMVMVGNMFAGCLETPGLNLNIDGKNYKEYVGSSTHKGKHVEGVAALVNAKGPFKEILNSICEGLKSGCSYQGVHDLIDLKLNPQFVKMSSSGLKESHAHDVAIIVR